MNPDGSQQSVCSNEQIEIRPFSDSHSWIYKGSECLATVRVRYAQVCLEAIQKADAISDNSTVLSVENQSHREE